ncbi:MAG TPA: acyl-CoA dehydrogenase family protein, partial [bacterium]
MLYTAEHREMQSTVQKFVNAEINPFVDQWEQERIFPAHEVFGKLGALGLLGVGKPAEYGGLGLDYGYSVAVTEALGHIHCGGIPMAIGVQTDMATPALAKHGSDELRREFLAPSIAGDYVAAIGVSEPGAGSDVAGIATQARRDGGDYVINGSKMWITNSVQADWMCMLAVTSEEGAPHRNKSLICVPMKAKGVTVAKKLDKLGMRSSDTALLYFEDVRVPQWHLIGEEGQGFIYQMQQFQMERMWIAAKALRMMERAVQETIAYTSQRKAFGRTILDNQVVHFRLAELQTEIEALRSLVHRAAEQ